MVIINLKISEKNQFFSETTTGIEISELIKELVLSKLILILVNNLRVRVDQICMSLEDLLKHGPLKPEALRGLKETEDMEPDIEDRYKVPKPKMPEKIGTRYNDDKTGQRTGWILEEDLTSNILKGVYEVKEYLKIYEAKKPSCAKDLYGMVELLKAGVMIGYPGYYGLPDWEPCMVLIEDKTDLLYCDQSAFEYFKLDTTSLWTAGKELERSKFLCDYIGKNEKTKIVCKFSTKGQGAPVKEPPIDKETHQKMLSYYFKKQEEQKKLEVENDDHYLNSQWADTNGLKKSFYCGAKDIKWKFK